MLYFVVCVCLMVFDVYGIRFLVSALLMIDGYCSEALLCGCLMVYFSFSSCLYSDVVWCFLLCMCYLCSL